MPAAADVLTHPQDHQQSFEWWKVLICVGIAFGIAQTQIARNSQEIDRLRTSNDARAQLDLVMARTVATKDDIEALRKEVAALGASMDAKFDRVRPLLTK